MIYKFKILRLLKAEKRNRMTLTCCIGTYMDVICLILVTETWNNTQTEHVYRHTNRWYLRVSNNIICSHASYLYETTVHFPSAPYRLPQLFSLVFLSILCFLIFFLTTPKGILHSVQSGAKAGLFPACQWRRCCSDGKMLWRPRHAVRFSAVPDER